jgi:hypothetical protein
LLGCTPLDATGKPETNITATTSTNGPLPQSPFSEEQMLSALLLMLIVFMVFESMAILELRLPSQGNTAFWPG